MTTLLDSLMKRNKQVQNTQLRHHSYLDDDAVIAHAEEASNSDKFKKLYAGDWEDLYDSQSDADMALLSILAFWCGCDEEQMDRIFRTSGLMRDKWDRRQAGTTYGAISIRNTVNTCAAVYVPVNAQDIVDEEFTNLDPESKSPEFQPDITKLTLSLDEMAPHTNPRYGRAEIGMGNMFADFFKPIARYNSERGIWYVSDTKNLVGDELVASAIKSAMAELGPNEVTNRTKIEPLAQQKLAESLNQKYGEGAVFINKVVINNMDFEEAYNTAIQQKSIAQQNADKQKIENEAAIAKAEADKQVAITNAEAEAQKTSIAADAQAEANRKIAESLSDPLIEYQKIQKWDGKLPTVSGSNALVSIDPAE